MKKSVRHDKSQNLLKDGFDTLIGTQFSQVFLISRHNVSVKDQFLVKPKRSKAQLGLFVQELQ